MTTKVRTARPSQDGHASPRPVVLHVSCGPVYRSRMRTQRLNISLDEERAAKLARLASRAHVNEGTVARSLLSAAIDFADPDVDTVVGVLDGIDGAWERAQLGREQAASGQTIKLREL
jgi:hypothetical protein